MFGKYQKGWTRNNFTSIYFNEAYNDYTCRERPVLPLPPVTTPPEPTPPPDPNPDLLPDNADCDNSNSDYIGTYDVDVIVNAANVVTDTGIYLCEGDEVEISVHPDQIWSAGPDEPFSRKSNADGISPEFYAQLTQGNLTANYGTLVGQIGGGEYFLVGTEFVGTASEPGRLSLYYWDDWFPDNDGQVLVEIRAFKLYGN